MRHGNVAESISSPVGQGGDGEASLCDIVVPVYNALASVADCLESVARHTVDVDHRLILVDDASDATTAGFLQSFVGRAPGRFVYLRHESNQGFVRAVNRGISEGASPYVCVLNSDTIVPPGWLGRLITCMDSDPRIALVNPATNRASHLVVPMPPGANIWDMDELLRGEAPRDYPDVVTGVGFCMLLRRSAIEAVGGLDEAFGRGYCEDSDLSMRLTTAGYRTVLDDATYVYHRGGASFKDSTERYRRNRRLFDVRWGRRYRRDFARFRRQDPLAGLRRRFRTASRWTPVTGAWEGARRVYGLAMEGRYGAVALEGARGARRALQTRTPLPETGILESIKGSRRLRVTYVIDRLVVAGGVLSVIQLVNGLIKRGVDARIATLHVDPAVREWMPLLTEPMVFRNPKALIDALPGTDVAVATLWSTAPWVEALARSGRASTTVHFLQDYEPWFHRGPEERARAKASLACTGHKIVKSDWLAELVAQEGYESVKFPLGMDLNRFYPREVEQVQAPVVLAMARPGTQRRGFRYVVDCLAQVKEAMPEARIVLFGDRFLGRRRLPFSFRDEGIVADPDRMAELYSEADVFLDGSDFQGFGRCGLEAMACGCACVLTDVGGVREYAIHGHNSLLVRPRASGEWAAAILDVLAAPARMALLRERGRETASGYGLEYEVEATEAFLRNLIGYTSSGSATEPTARTGRSVSTCG